MYSKMCKRQIYKISARPILYNFDHSASNRWEVTWVVTETPQHIHTTYEQFVRQCLCKHIYNVSGGLKLPNNKQNQTTT